MCMCTKRMTRFRGTMIVKNSTRMAMPKIRSEQEQYQDRKRSRGSKKRLSAGEGTRRHKTKATLQQALVGIVFSLMNYRPAQSERVWNEVASLTSSKKRALTEDEVVHLEHLFNALCSELNHIFLPWIRTPSMRGSAEDYLDVSFIVDVVDRVASKTIPSDATEKEMDEIMKPVKHLRRMLEVPKRRLTVR